MAEQANPASCMQTCMRVTEISSAAAAGRTLPGCIFPFPSRSLARIKRLDFFASLHASNLLSTLLRTAIFVSATAVFPRDRRERDGETTPPAARLWRPEPADDVDGLDRLERKGKLLLVIFFLEAVENFRVELFGAPCSDSSGSPTIWWRGSDFFCLFSHPSRCRQDRLS